MPGKGLIRAVVIFVCILCAQWSHAQLLQLDPIANNLNRPVAITHAADGSGRLFITQQTGQVLIHDGSQVLATPFLDISSKVECCGERGLLSIAFHPEYGQSGSPNSDYFYVYYTAKTTGLIVIARYTTTANANIADPNSELILLSIIHDQYPNHDGGQLQFGPDGYLYIGTGDGGGGGDPLENGQSLNSLLGKILRLDVDAASPYIPNSNPFQNDGNPNTLGQIWAYGLRNPWRFSFDRVTGDLIIGDVGQNCFEEVDFQPAGSSGGENYGWDVMEGSKCFDEPSGSSCSMPPTCSPASYTGPVLDYRHGAQGFQNVQAVTGGFVYRGSAMPQYYGKYFFADYGSGQIWVATPGGGTWPFSEVASTGELVSSFGEDEAGELYYASLGFSAGTGTVYRINAPPATPYSDDFADNDVSDWTPLKGLWDATGGAMRGTTTTKASITSPYGGCTVCTVDADVQFENSGARASILAWYQGKADTVELLVMEDRDRIVLRQISGGSPIFRKKATLTIDTGVNYHFTISFDGTSFQVFLNADTTPLISSSTSTAPFGTVGFKIKSPLKTTVTVLFDSIAVN